MAYTLMCQIRMSKLSGLETKAEETPGLFTAVLASLSRFQGKRSQFSVILGRGLSELLSGNWKQSHLGSQK
jgi:hypothetical protein